MRQIFERGMEKGGSRVVVPEEFREGGKPFILAGMFASLDILAQMEVLRKLEEAKNAGCGAEELLKAAEGLVNEAKKLKIEEGGVSRLKKLSVYKRKGIASKLPSVSAEMEDIEEDVATRLSRKDKPTQDELLDRFLGAMGKTSGKHPAHKPKYKNINRNVHKGEPPWWDMSESP